MLSRGGAQRRGALPSGVQGVDAFDVLRATFPAGTVSGAPKVRAMEIIEELEGTRRGPYAGAVGYVGFDGNMDTCITIRTIVMHGEQCYVQAGAGIVADSDPTAEYQETLNKARALTVAVELAERGLVDDGRRTHQVSGIGHQISDTQYPIPDTQSQHAV